MRYDESWSYLNFASKGPSYVATHYIANNHVLHSLFMWLSGALLGPEPTSLRLPGFLAGVLLIPATAWLALEYKVGRAGAVFAAAAVAVSSTLVEYAVNGRGYSMVALATVILLICFRRAWDRPQLRRWWILAGIGTAAGVYTVPVMVLAFVAAAVPYCFLVPKRAAAKRRQCVRGIAATVSVATLLICALYAPILVNEGVANTVAAVRFGARVMETQTDGLVDMAVATWRTWTRDAHFGWTVLLVMAALAHFCRAISHCKSGREPLLLSLSLLSLAVLITMTGLVTAARAILFALPIALVCAADGIAFGLANLQRPLRSARLIRVVGVAGVMLVLTLSGRNVWRRDYMCTIEHNVVDIEPILEECHRFGPRHCALVARYTPATAYYVGLRGMTVPAATEAEGTRRIYIFTDATLSIDDAWNDSIAGIEHYGPPCLWRTFSRSTLYIADRTAPVAARDDAARALPTAGAR